MVRLVEWPYDIRVHDLGGVCYSVCLFAGYGYNIIDPLFQSAHHSGYAPGKVKVLHVMGAARQHIAYMGRFLADPVKELKREIYPCFMRYCRNMKNCIGRASERHIHEDRVLESI